MFVVPSDRFTIESIWVMINALYLNYKVKWMSLSQTVNDPFKHLKRIKNKTPSKKTKILQSNEVSQSSLTIDNHQVESKLEETALLK